VFRKVIFWVLAWSGAPLVLYDLAGMAITVVLLMFNGSAWLALYFWLLGLTSIAFVSYIFYAALKKLVYKPILICGGLMMLEYFHYFFLSGKVASPFLVVYVFVYTGLGLVVPFGLRMYGKNHPNYDEG